MRSSHCARGKDSAGGARNHAENVLRSELGMLAAVITEVIAASRLLRRLTFRNVGRTG
jgi:hypothetical protein